MTASCGELHFSLSSLTKHFAATLDSIRRITRRDTFARADVTKNELGRRYGFLGSRKPTGEPIMNIMDIIRSRDDNVITHTPWLAWCRQLVLSQQKVSVWTVTADSTEEFLQMSGLLSAHSSSATSFVPGSVGRSHSPTYGFSSPLSSPRSSFSISPLSHNSSSRANHKHLELNRSLSANPVIEDPPFPPLLPGLSRSLSLTQTKSTGDFEAPTGQRRSIDVVEGAKAGSGSFTNLNESPRSSLDRGPEPQQQSTSSKPDKDSIRKKFRASPSVDKTRPLMEFRTPTVSSVFGVVQQPHGALPSSSRLHLGVGNMFDRIRWGGDEVLRENNPRSRSSVSDERDSAREEDDIKSDGATGLGSAGKTLSSSALDLRDLRSREKGASHTSDSEVGGGGGLLTARIGKRFRRADKDPSAEETTGEAQGSISAGEQRRVDSLTGPGWISRRGVRRARSLARKEFDADSLREMLRRQEVEEERAKEIYKARELLLVEANDHNRKIARLLKAICASIREYEDVQSELAQSVGFQHRTIPTEILDAISADPATTLRHGKGWQAVEDSHQRFRNQQELLASYLSILTTTPEQGISSHVAEFIHRAKDLWQSLRVKSHQIEKQVDVVEPALNRAVAHMENVQNEFNSTQILVETAYPEVG
ncbi:hypothetical protein K439DRAFT_204562 [Ramaria rubella]|nr:hypothetical protein K439DRAFT_204562 [Ramaria rubella]